MFWEDVVKDEDNREEFSSLPSDDFIADCKKFKSIFPERNAKDSLMLVRLPKTLNGGLTLKSLGELAKKYFSVVTRGYRFIWPAIVQELGDKSIDKSHWVLMTKDVLPGSRAKSYGQQKKIVDDLAEKTQVDYQVPALEAAVCILSHTWVQIYAYLAIVHRPIHAVKRKFKVIKRLLGASPRLASASSATTMTAPHWRCGPAEVLRSLVLGHLAFGKGLVFCSLVLDLTIWK